MAIDAYLQIDGIKGESTDDKHKDWLEVSHVTYGVHQLDPKYGDRWKDPSNNADAFSIIE